MYIAYVGTYSDPWTVKDEDAVYGMQRVWDMVYVEKTRARPITHTVEVNGAVFGVVSDLD
jgi:hypothetical protein